MIHLIVDLLFASSITYCLYYVFDGISELYNT